MDTETYRRFTQRLTELRELRGLTQRQLAKKLKRHHSIVGFVEAATRRLDVMEYVAWCDALDVDPSTFLREFLEDK